MLVSRKYLSLIHFVARKLAARVHVTEAVVKFRDLRGANATGSVLNEPFAESIDQGPVLAASDFAGAFNVRFGGAKSDVLHMELSIAHLVARELSARSTRQQCTQSQCTRQAKFGCPVCACPLPYLHLRHDFPPAKARYLPLQELACVHSR